MEKIDPNKEYSPQDIADAGWIYNTVGNNHDYDFVLKLVQRNLLKSRNINPDGERPWFRVKGQWIMDYLNGK